MIGRKNDFKRWIDAYINVKEGKLRTLEIDVSITEGEEFIKRLTPRELVEKAGVFFFFDKTMKNSEGGYGKESNICVAEEQKDVENARIKCGEDKLFMKMTHKILTGLNCNIHELAYPLQKAISMVAS